MPVILDEHSINSLLYADDLLILSESASILQKCLNGVGKFYFKCGLDIYNKSNVTVFSKSSKLFYFHLPLTALS